MKTFTHFTLLLLSLITFSVTAQTLKGDTEKDLSIRMEEVKTKCDNIPHDKRIRVVVARFNSTANSASRELGLNMTTMLTNALSQVNCFTVLEEKRNLSDLKSEIDLSSSEYSDAASGLEKGKMKIAQVIFTGEITEYNEIQTTHAVFGVTQATSKVHMGFIIKMINPTTREILASKSFNIDSKTGYLRSVGILNIKKTSSHTNPALANALEQGVVAAVEYLVSEKDKIVVPVTENYTTLIINNFPFSEKIELLETIRHISTVKEATLKSYNDSTIVFTIKHIASTDSLLTLLYGRIQDQYDVISVQSGDILLKRK